MRKLLFVLCLCAASTAIAQTPTATATSTSTPTPTATATPTASATGTPVPTPTPIAVISVQDVQGQKKAITVKMGATNTSGVNYVDGILMNPGANIGFADIFGPYYDIGRSDDPLDNGSFWRMTRFDNPGLYKHDLSASLGFNISALTSQRVVNWPDKTGTVAYMDDIPTGSLIGTAGFNTISHAVGDLVKTGIIDDITETGAVYTLTFLSAQADINYRVDLPDAIGADGDTIVTGFVMPGTKTTTGFDFSYGAAISSIAEADEAQVLIFR